VYKIPVLHGLAVIEEVDEDEEPVAASGSKPRQIGKEKSGKPSKHDVLSDLEQLQEIILFLRDVILYLRQQLALLWNANPPQTKRYLELQQTWVNFELEKRLLEITNRLKSLKF